MFDTFARANSSRITHQLPSPTRKPFSKCHVFSRKAKPKHSRARDTYQHINRYTPEKGTKRQPNLDSAVNQYPPTMSFICLPIVCGVKQWDSQYDPSPQLNSIYCPNCHNYSVGPVKRKEFVTIWFIPIFPIYWGKQLRCPICQWRQDFKNRDQLDKVLREQQNIAVNK